MGFRARFFAPLRMTKLVSDVGFQGGQCKILRCAQNDSGRGQMCSEGQERDSSLR